MIFRGKVVRDTFATGSKSEHEAVMLLSGPDRFVLRRRGGNPFADESLSDLVGKEIECEGILHGYTIIFDSCKVA